MNRRLFWRLYWPVAVLAFLLIGAPLVGPSIEGRLRPIRGAQTITNIIRTDARLCWDWTFVKLRVSASFNLDAFLEVNSKPGGVTGVFELESGRPWGILKYAVSPRPEPYTLRYCISLPPYIGQGDAVVVHQQAYYPGLLGLWTLTVPFPDVVSLPAER